MSLGVPGSHHSANPCKLPSTSPRWPPWGVQLTTSTLPELAKIASMASDMKVLLRLRVDDPSARCVLGNKYGAEPAEVEPCRLPRRRSASRLWAARSTSARRHQPGGVPRGDRPCSPRV